MLSESKTNKTNEPRNTGETLYTHIECAFAKLKNAKELSVQFQIYCKQAYGGAPPTALVEKSTELSKNQFLTSDRRAQRKLLRKWRGMHDALDKALANVVAEIEPSVLQSFENEHIVLVFYSVVANYAIDIDKSQSLPDEHRWWPKLDSADDITAQAYQLSRSFDEELLDSRKNNSALAKSVSTRCRPRMRAKSNHQNRCRPKCVHLKTDNVASTSNGYFADGCRVHALHRN